MTKRFRVLSALAYNDPLYHQGITEFAFEAQWELDLTVSYYGSVPLHWKGDGIITHYLDARPTLMDWIRRQNVPVVSINADEIPDWPGTAPDHRQCGKMAADYLMSLGLHHFAFFRCSDQNSIIERHDSFREAVMNRGHTFHLIDWRDTSDIDRTTERLASMIAELPLPLGVLCQSDHRAAMLFNACEAAGRAIPEDIAVLAVGNNETLCKFSRVALSSLDTDMKRIARQGAAMLDRMMQGIPLKKKTAIVPPLGVVQRQSTAMMRSVNPHVAKALQYIMTHSSKPINVNDICHHVGGGRARLGRLFNIYVGRSVSSELLRIRIDHAKNLLLTTNKKIGEIAGETGFRSYIHFAKSFQRAVGCSAQQFVRMREFK